MMQTRNPYFGVVFTLFYALIIVGLIAAKAAGHLHWAWWFVLLPIWAPIVVVLAIALILIIGLGAAQANGENPFQ